MIVESYALVCPHPQATVAVVVAYSHRYNPGNADPESSKKAAKLFDTLEFETLAPAAVADSLARRYAAKAEAARDAGNWREERLNLKLAITNAEIAGEPPGPMSGLNYEYGRASGVLCDWAEAEKGLKNALGIQKGNSAPVGIISSTLIELGRMHFDQRHFSVAAQYFSEAYPLAQEAGFETKDPLGVARFLDEYATALEQTQKDAEARPLRTRALELRNKFPDEKAKTDRTPYGTQCSTS
jgi:tetratricopeptide (TPR) repeat protein